MLRTEWLRTWSDDDDCDRVDRTCDECGCRWDDVTAADGGPDPRGFLRVTGALGESAVAAVLCPACADALQERVYEAHDLLDILKEDRPYGEEKAVEWLRWLMHWRGWAIPGEPDQPPFRDEEPA